MHRNQPLRVLVSGAADYGMLAHLLWAADHEGHSPDITIIDRCNTPLRLNQWYADRLHMPINTVATDMLSFQDTEGFDVICTHSFIGWFAPHDQKRLITNCRANLKSGGLLVTTKRIRSTAMTGGLLTFEEIECQSFRDRVQMTAQNRFGRLDILVNDLTEAAYDYAKCYRRYHLSSIDVLRRLFEDGGFALRQLDVGPRPEGKKDRPAGPIKGAGARMRIIAQRLG